MPNEGRQDAQNNKKDVPANEDTPHTAHLSNETPVITDRATSAETCCVYVHLGKPQSGIEAAIRQTGSSRSTLSK